MPKEYFILYSSCSLPWGLTARHSSIYQLRINQRLFAGECQRGLATPTPTHPLNPPSTRTALRRCRHHDLSFRASPPLACLVPGDSGNMQVAQLRISTVGNFLSSSQLTDCAGFLSSTKFEYDLKDVTLGHGAANAVSALTPRRRRRARWRCGIRSPCLYPFSPILTAAALPPSCSCSCGPP